MFRSFLVILVATPLLALAGAGLAAGTISTVATDSTAAVRVVRWSDGDTVVTSVGTVRLIGVDTPERGRCGSISAAAQARRLAPAGSTVRLINPVSVSDRDRYGRLLRYVVVGGADVALRQIRAGAKARYDGLDGYDWHPRQARYRLADRRNPDYCTGGGNEASYPPVSSLNCPANAPIKGNLKTGDPDWREPYKGIYHVPGQEYYAITSPEQCFATEAGAVKAGYRRAYS